MKGNRAIVTAVVVVIVLILGWYLLRRSGSSGHGRSPRPVRPGNEGAGHGKLPGRRRDAGRRDEKAIAPPGVAGTRLTWKVRVPDDGWLRVNLGLKPDSWQKQGDGVLFKVLVSNGKASEELFTQHVDPFNNAAEPVDSGDGRPVCVRRRAGRPDFQHLREPSGFLAIPTTICRSGVHPEIVIR